MRHHKSYFTLVVFMMIFVLESCVTPGVPLKSSPTTNNKTYEIAYLFEHDGCKVYRFIDLGNCVYFTSCSGQTTYQADSVTVIQNNTNLGRF